MLKYHSKNRFNYSIFIALVAHALILLGIGFSWANDSTTVSSIEVTLAQYKAAEIVFKADFFAQIDQQGSGEAEHKVLLSDRQLAADQLSPAQNIANPTQPENNSPLNPIKNQTPADKKNNISIFEVVISEVSQQTQLLKQPKNTVTSVTNNPQKNNLSAQIVALKSQINLRKQEMANAPKKRVISTMSTKSHEDAAYLENWRRRIVTLGNIHYPKAANEQKMYGSVRFLIAMRADGNIQSIEILESSGKQILDHGAVKIIRLAAPFQPFSAKMRENTDILEIIRTIEFEKTTRIY